ncbi:MAG: 4Fe-4S binding protein [Methanomassiliicoccaceae archaeon]|nr:4Fe-4S binding protein [Methanomassiliicoccaceae archaeon]
MKKEDIIADAAEFTQNSSFNYVAEDAAIRPDLAGMKLFNPPIFAFGSADDELYSRYRSPDVIGGHFLLPSEWLPTANTVISFFLPFTERIKKANAADYRWPAYEWLYGRVEGQIFVRDLSVRIQRLLSDAGHESIVPLLDTRFKVGSETTRFTSNWSERHVAFACGLGTFGLSKGIITEKGMCGRLGSIITELELPKDVRPYREVYEYCTMCGACAAHCPAHAISVLEGKKHPPCSDFLDRTKEVEKTRYGCGKCQVKVPCESRIPKKK